jgi:hypothetical protein
MKKSDQTTVFVLGGLVAAYFFFKPKTTMLPLVQPGSVAPGTASVNNNNATTSAIAAGGNLLTSFLNNLKGGGSAPINNPTLDITGSEATYLDDGSGQAANANVEQLFESMAGTGDREIFD